MKKEISERLATLFDERGSLTVDMILKEARKPKSPLHSFFEWDPVKAHSFYLRERARELIRKWYVQKQLVENTVLVRGAVSLYVDDEESEGRAPTRAYFGTDHVLRSSTLTQKMLEVALAELESFQRKYATLTELSAVFAAIDEVKSAQKRKSA